MVHEVLSPGVEHSEEADLCAEMFWVGGNGAKRLGGSTEEDVVDDFLVLKRDRGYGVGHSKDYVEVVDLEKLRLASLKPSSPSQRLAFGTMPVSAGVVRNDSMSTAVAFVYVTTERSSPAVLDGAHSAMLRTRHRSCVLFPILRTVLPEDIGHFQRWPAHLVLPVQLSRSGSRSRGLDVAQTVLVETWV